MKAFVALALGALVAVVLAATASAAPTPVLLGNAGLFALLAGSGLTNTGVSTVTGDVGSSPTPSETGFAACPAADCVALTGANHTDPSPNDTATQNGKADLTTAYNAAAGQTPTQIPTELAGTTLTAGVYTSAAGTLGMTGTLTLDGANNADSIFIFQTASTLITGGTGKVSFINGAQACNVFWQVGSAATLGAGSDFSGTILAHDNISVADGVTVHGRLLAGEQSSGTGAVTLIHDTIVKPTTCTTQASVDAASQAAAQAQAQAAAAAQAAATAQAAADQAAAAARAANEAAASQAAAQAAAAAAAAVKAAADAAAIAAQAASDAANAAIAKQAAATAATAARHAKAAAARAHAAKVKAARLAKARAVVRRRHAVRAPKTHAGFTG
jgi:hypothetical protein